MQCMLSLFSSDGASDVAMKAGRMIWLLLCEGGYSWIQLVTLLHETRHESRMIVGPKNI